MHLRDFQAHQTVKDVIDDYDALANLLESIEYFLCRLETYTEIPSAVDMNEMIVKILVELLSTLALATRQTKEGKLSEYVIGDAIVNRPNETQKSL